MATPTKVALPSPITMKDVELTIGTGLTNDYSRHVSAVTLTPSASTVIWKGLSPDAVFTDVTSATWTCEIAYVQDWASTTSLSRYLFDNEGQVVDARFEPKSGGTAFLVKLVIVPGAVGGAIDSTAVATVTLGVVGRPTTTAVANT